jgi:hypothetical protein
MKQMQGRFGYCLLAAVLVAAFLVSPAAAFEAKLSGQVNQMLMWADDGDEDDFFVTDNSNSSTRFRFTGAKAFGKVTAGFQIEFEAQRNRSSALTMGQDNDGAFNWNDRWLNAYFDTAFGKFEIGKGSGAADTTAEMDLSGTGVINYSSVSDTAGGFLWKNSDGTDFGTTVGATRNNFDGYSRSERFRYNTPRFAGLTFSTSITNGELWEAALFYAADFAGNRIAAAVGYVDGRKREDYTQWSGSVSWLAPFGLNITGAYGLRDHDAPGRDDANNYYFKVGYRWAIHAVSVEYGWTEDLRINGEESSNWGLAYVITPWPGVEFYTSYRQYMLDAVAVADPDDIRQVMLGTRIRF